VITVAAPSRTILSTLTQLVAQIVQLWRASCHPGPTVRPLIGVEALEERYALARVLPVPGLTLVEAEQFAARLPVHWRSNASRDRAVWLHDGEQIRLRFHVKAAGIHNLSLRVANDGPVDTLQLFLQKTPIRSVEVPDTRGGHQRPGDGWNEVIEVPVGTFWLAQGTHVVTIAAQTDRARRWPNAPDYGTEVDALGVLLLQPKKAIPDRLRQTIGPCAARFCLLPTFPRI
jgi:hypothetical protein